MISDWMRWCRLCGNEKGSSTLESGTELVNLINTCFGVSSGTASVVVCLTCEEFMMKLREFWMQVQDVDKMFKELMTGCLNNEDLLGIRMKYGLEEKKVVNGTDDVKVEEIETNKRKRPQRKRKPSPVTLLVKEEPNIEYISTPDAIPDKFNTSEEKSLDIDQEIERMIDQTPVSDDETDQNYEANETGDTPIEYKQKSEQKLSKYECDVCQKSYSRRQTLEEHIRFKHGTEQDLKHQCDVCQRKFISEKKLKQHSISHLPPDEKMIHPCKYCDKKFTKSVNVVAHIKAVHIGLRPFICESCGRSFQSKGALKDHQITHSDEQPWACSQCPKRFKNQARLKTHEDIHNTTSYICPHCGLALNTKRTLKMHLVVHSNEKKYKCNYCGSEYKRSKALKNHLILHTGLRPYACPFCNKTFANGSNCRSHKKKAHPVELAALEASGVKSTVAIPRLEMLQPKTTSNFTQIPSESIELSELTEQHSIHTLPSLITTSIGQCAGIQVVGMQEPTIIHQNATATTTQVITQIPATTTRTYHVPVTMLSIIEQPSSVETKHETL